MAQQNPPQYGYHSSIARGYLSAIERPVALGARAVQLWMGNSKGYASRMIPEAEYNPVAQLVEEKHVFLIAHSPYILNFARPLQDTAVGKRALERYLNDLINVKNLGGRGSILHMGSNVKELKQDFPDCYRQFVANLEWIIERKPKDVFIILENMAGGGNQMCAYMYDWADFWQNYMPERVKKHVRWCVDTAHLYAAGEYDFSEPEEVRRFYSDFSDNIGWEYLLCFHFNGSKSKYGSNHDNHADICPESSGYIKTAGLRELARLAARTKKPMILEVPTDKYTIPDQFELLESWFK